jgi:hypothetical protein
VTRRGSGALPMPKPWDDSCSNPLERQPFASFSSPFFFLSTFSDHPIHDYVIGWSL